MTVGSIVEGGFRLIRERPGAVLIWILVQLVATVGATFVTVTLLQSSIEALMSGKSQESVQATYVLQSCLFGLVGLMVSTILYAAAQRAILRPAEGGPGWLRLGMDEVRLYLLALLYIVAFVIALIIVGIFAGLFLAGAGDGARQAIAIIFGAIGLVALVYFGTKLSLTFPLTLMEKRFAVGDGWSLTNGRFWALAAAYLIVFLILLVTGLLIMAATQWEYLSAIFQYGFASFEAQQAGMREYQLLMAGTIDAPIIIGWVLTAVQGGIGYALMGGAAATAVQQLSADGEGLSETFS